jgi:hypothetical protein
VVRFRSRRAMGIRIGQESLPFIRVSLFRLLRTQTIPYTTVAISFRLVVIAQL